MNIGIDNYSYHRYFGEVYPGQPPPPQFWQLSDFVDHILNLPELPLVEGLSIETCFLPNDVDKTISELSRINIPFLFQWGHPDGFMNVPLRQVFSEIKKYFELSQWFHSNVLRIVASSIHYFSQPHQPQIEKAYKYLEKILPLAEEFNIKLALENHGDFYLHEIQRIIERFDTPYLGVVLDTGNFLRLNEQPLDVISIFGEKIYLVHIKDVSIMPGYAPDDPRRFGCVPAGEGITDFSAIFANLYMRSYQGMLLIEISRMHPQYEQAGEIAMIRTGLEYLHKMRAQVGYSHAAN